MTSTGMRAHQLPGLIAALVGLLVLFLAAAGFERKESHTADIDRLERKLDCALWELPRNCRETMAPRGP